MDNNFKIKVSLIDDHAILRQSLANALGRDNGIEVVGQWESAEDALSFLCSNECDVVILDHVLPGMDGVSAIRYIKKLNPSIKIIILTMFSGEDVILHAFEAGASGFLPKESDLSELKNAIVKVNNGESVLSNRITDRFMKFCSLLTKNKPKDKTLNGEQAAILKMAGEGLSNKEIAVATGLSTAVVKNRFREIFELLEAKDRTHAVVLAIKKGILRDNGGGVE